MIRYGKLVPGREVQAIQLFNETTRYFQEKLAAKAVTSFEPFLMATSDLEEELGFFIVKGTPGDIFALMQDEGYRYLVEKGLYLVEHLRTDLLTVGEGIADQLERSAKVRAELGV